MTELAPVLFLSHGTAALLQEDSGVRDYWKKLGQDALDHGVKGVIIMGAHWNTAGDDPLKVQIAMNPAPDFMPLVASDPKLSAGFKPNPDLETGQRVIDLLCNNGVHAEADTKFNWMIDTQIALVGMFGVKTPPITIISQNAYWDPFFHSRLGEILRPLRKEGYLIIGSGGGTHNLYRTEWKYSLGWKDVFAMESPPDDETLEFRQSIEDVFCKNGAGPELRRGLARLMKHPYFRDAHGTDEHYVSACFAAGAVGELEDRGTNAVLGAEVWELRSQCEQQYMIGQWPASWKAVTAAR
ncbi:Extradiol ring-cleavage dioxygenase, class III enzyme, subunit B [Aspergillus keveii]|uniref:Extradiol ring-cleavage dioxygenase, class III enzyme, subunit B n=1 Tax=Aspergillus keveii TaxID=714993 RepID=A0ABR4FJR9_9EURO